MTDFLILRLTNAALACDAKRDFAMAELLTEAILEIENARNSGYASLEGATESGTVAA